MAQPMVEVAGAGLYTVVVACVGVAVLADDLVVPALFDAGHAHGAGCHVDGGVDADGEGAIGMREPRPVGVGVDDGLAIGVGF